MPSPAQDLRQRLDHFEKVCRAAGLRLTHQRLEVFREVARSGEHPDAESIHRGVRKRLPTVSLDTVYRTLWLLTDLGLITILGPSRERTRFDANLDPHHHFVCVRCGLMRDFTCPELDAVALPAEAWAFGRIEATHVEARGLCRDCARQAAHPNPGKKPPGP